ncbi:Helix-turn-helix domain, partial [Dysosmobacter welbionis]
AVWPFTVTLPAIKYVSAVRREQTPAADSSFCSRSSMLSSLYPGNPCFRMLRALSIRGATSAPYSSATRPT